MRTLERNKQPIFYANLTTSANDVDGGYIVIDGVSVPVETGGFTQSYTKPEKKNVSISFSGESNIQPFGVDIGGYDAIIVANKGYLPITETSLIWYKSTPVYLDPEETIVDPNSADYTVRAIDDSLNVFRAFLARSVKNNDT